MTVLRPYQLAAVESVRAAWAEGARAPLLVMPTGAGKTATAADMIERAAARGRRVLFLAPRRELIHQTVRALGRVGITPGVLLAGADPMGGLYAPVQVASIDTLHARLVRRQRMVLPEPHLIILDEAHLFVTLRRATLIGYWPGARLLGLTATPTRKDGKALGVLFDRLIEGATVADLTAQGFLVPARYFAPSVPDLERIRTVAGDYSPDQLAERMNTPKLVGDVVQHWLAKAGGRRTVVFAVDRAHSVALAEEFVRAGVAAEHVDGDTPQQDREATFARFTSGAAQVLCNCQLASYGFDLPALSCVVLARPTRSLMLYLQMVGRGLRPADGKADCLVLDHAGNVDRHGFAADDRRWTLKGVHALMEPQQSVRTPGEGRPITCPECAAVFSTTTTCPECGYHIQPRARMVEAVDGELVEVGDAGAQIDRAQFFAELRGYTRERGFKPGFAAATYRERFGTWPPRGWEHHDELEPSLATRRWLKSRQIAWAKRKSSASGALPPAGRGEPDHAARNEALPARAGAGTDAGTDFLAGRGSQ